MGRRERRGCCARLKENGEREVRLIGVDMSERAIGRHLCDAFHLVPPGADPTFPDALLGLVEEEGVDVVLPESSHDLRHLAPRRGEFPVPVMISGPDAERRSNDKAETFETLQRIGVGAPEFRRVTGAAGVEAAARELGYPERPVCFKPVFSSGSRGFRCSTRPSTARTSCSTSGPARSRCASRRRSSCSPRRVSTCS